MYETRMVRVGDLTLGGHNPVWVQSMTNTDTRDAQATLVQIRALAKAGCDIVRVSVYDEDCARAVRTLVDGSPVPLVADIHFDYKLALECVRISTSTTGLPLPRRKTASTSCASIPATSAAKRTFGNWRRRQRRTTSRFASA